MSLAASQDTIELDKQGFNMRVDGVASYIRQTLPRQTARTFGVYAASIPAEP